MENFSFMPDNLLFAIGWTVLIVAIYLVGFIVLIREKSKED